ncbi:hypothetical protein AURDEDRAFT_164169 [Auricularia subglabra TFB-10046 SS5]|nr:hypothetical protein AURDEDRAFT_164169 [Auricularia subglabra TFB-10046 SS5]
MPSQATEYPRASVALAGLGLTTQLALAATDGIPIVKQIVGVVARIVTFAQEIKARRDALHALVDDARAIGRSVEAVASGRELEGEMLARLEALYSVLRAVETLLAEHRTKRRLYRALRYAWTIQNVVETRSRELSRAVQQFLLVAALDTNAFVQDSAGYIGKFRLLRDFEVDRQDLVMEETPKGTSYSIKYYTARIEGSGQVFAVRFLERNAQTSLDGTTNHDRWLQRQMIEHDMILQQISYAINLMGEPWMHKVSLMEPLRTVQKAHPNIARFYGRSAGDITGRFAVMRSGQAVLRRVKWT